MVQLNPVPVLGAKKNTSTIWRKFSTKISLQMVSALELHDCRVQIQIPMRKLKLTWHCRWATVSTVEKEEVAWPSGQRFGRAARRS